MECYLKNKEGTNQKENKKTVILRKDRNLNIRNYLNVNVFMVIMLMEVKNKKVTRRQKKSKRKESFQMK